MKNKILFGFCITFVVISLFIVVSADTIFVDDFNRADSTSLGSNWIELHGEDYKIASDKLVTVSTKDSRTAIVSSINAENITAGAYFMQSSSGGVEGLILRYQDSKNYYLFYRSIGSSAVVRIIRVVNGKSKTLISAAYNYNTIKNFTLNASAIGSNLTLIYNEGKSQISIIDTSFSSGSVGLYSSSSTVNFIDNFTVIVKQNDVPRECTESDWTSSISPSTCPSTSQQTKTWTKISSCTGGVTHPDSEIISCTYVPNTCTSFTYSSWSSCNATGMQTRTITSSSPTSCTGGTPENLTQACTPICTSFTYSSWSTCVNSTFQGIWSQTSLKGNQSRIITTSSPLGCAGGTPQSLAQSCTTSICTAFTYSPWSTCVNNQQNRTIVAVSPSYCSGGTPATLTQNCTVIPPAPVCGNSIVESGEQCDDGNLFEGDGCSAYCKVESCGNNICDYNLVGGVYVAETALSCPVDCAINTIDGTAGNDVFQVHHGKVWVNGIERATISPNSGVLRLNGLDGDDTFVTVGAGSQTITGGAGFDSYWYDTTDVVNDISTEETTGKTVHSIASYQQPWAYINAYTYNTSYDASSPDYISLESNGQNLRDPLALPYGGGSAYAYRNVWNPVYPYNITDNINHTTIKQGNLGNCYLLATFASLASNNPMQRPDILKQSIVSIGDGTYIVRLYSGTLPAVPQYIRVDADLPVSSGGALVFDGAGTVYNSLALQPKLWGPLMEKAYTLCHFCGQDGSNTYQGINGGWMEPVYEQLVGGNIANSYYSSSSTFPTVYSWISNKKAPTLGTRGTYTNTTIAGCTGTIVKNHAEAIIINTSSTTFSIYNPWATSHISCNQAGLAEYASNFASLA